MGDDGHLHALCCLVDKPVESKKSGSGLKPHFQVSFEIYSKGQNIFSGAVKGGQIVKNWQLLKKSESVIFLYNKTGWGHDKGNK